MLEYYGIPENSNRSDILEFLIRNFENIMENSYEQSKGVLG